MAARASSKHDELSDFIEVSNMEFTGFLGTTEGERQRPQPLYIDLKIYLDLSRAGISDAIRDTVNYHRIRHLIGDYIHESKHRLLEVFATEICELLLEKCQRIQAITVKIKKPHALRNTDFTAVQLHRKRQTH